MATINIVVTVANPGSGNRYYLDGVLQATISATAGNTYKFDQADGSNSGHPLRLSITSNGTHSGGSAYTTGVTTSGTPGSAGAYTQIEVTATTVQALYYYCTNHSNMGGSFNVGGTGTVQFQDISGFRIENLSSDASTVGQMYYNSTSGQFKAITAGLGSWASGEDTSTPAAQRGSASTASNTDAFVSGGFNAMGSSVTANAEAYNGTTWAEGPNQPGTNRLGMSWGAANTYVTAGGSTGTGGQPINPYAFEWNDVSFSNGGQLNNARRNGSGAGISSDSGRGFGGGDNPGPAQNFNEGYNGTAFSNDTALNTARIGGVGMGVKDLALYTGGASGTPGLLNEKWDGSSWTEIGDLTVAVNNSGGRAGTTTSGLVFSKTDPGAQSCQSWDGVSWATQSAQAVNRYNNTGSGPDNTNAISVGGYGPPAANQVATEVWNIPDFTVKTLTTT